MRLNGSILPVLLLALAGTSGLAGTAEVRLPQPRVMTAGSGSGGDPYFPHDGNGGYDVVHYDIAVTYRPGTDGLRGRTVLRATAHEALSRFNLDLVLEPDEVTVDGVPARFDKPTRHELQVTPAEPLVGGQAFTVRVRYHGRPSSLGAVGVRSGRDLYFHRDGETLAIGEPQSAPWWFPANETPADKATYDIVLRVPQGREAVSNGELRSRTLRGRWVRWAWEMTEPMTTYLAFFAAGDFRLDRGTADGRRFVYAVSTRLRTAEQNRYLRLLRRSTAVVTWLEDRLGAYPFGSVGGVVAGISLPYALETQSRPVYGPGWLDTPLLVHELAHQWFGNSVSVRRWRDIWLNEGFATYAEWWYRAGHGGRSVRQRMLDDYDGWPAGSGFWKVSLSDPGPADMFSGSVYQRGAMTLAALRQRIGRTHFDTVLRRWVADHAHGHAAGADFRALAEQVSGVDLGTFFAHWLDDPSQPARTAENGLVRGTGDRDRMSP